MDEGQEAPGGILPDSRELKKCREEIEQLKKALVTERGRTVTLSLQLDSFKEALKLLSNSAIQSQLTRIQHELERMNQEMSEQFPQTREALERQRQAIAEVGTKLTTEIQQIKDKFDQLTVPPNEQPIVDEINQSIDVLSNLGNQIGDIVPDASPPGSRRK